MEAGSTWSFRVPASDIRFRSALPTHQHTEGKRGAEGDTRLFHHASKRK